jgi:Na+/proline symporter
MAATTVNDFYVPFFRPAADDAERMRVARRATVGWGIVQLAVAIGGQWMDRGVLDAGLAVLSLAAGPVLGAFLIGVLTRDVGSRAMLIGMGAGILVLVWVWWTGAVAWTWYAFVGAGVTALTAVLMGGVGRVAARPVS